MLLFIFFHLLIFVNENTENKMLFVTQFVFYLMVLFVRAANKEKVTHGKTNHVLSAKYMEVNYRGSNSRGVMKTKL